MQHDRTDAVVSDVQAMPHTVRVVGGKQRGHRSAVRDLSRDEAVTDASKWGLLKVLKLESWFVYTLLVFWHLPEV